MIELVVCPSKEIKKELSQKLSMVLFEIDTLPLMWFKNDNEAKQFLGVDFYKNTENTIYDLSSLVTKKIYDFFNSKKDDILKYSFILNSNKQEYFYIAFNQVFYNEKTKDYINNTIPILWAEKVFFFKEKYVDVKITSKRFFEVLSLLKNYDFDTERLLSDLTKKNTKQTQLVIATTSFIFSIREIIFSMLNEYYLIFNSKNNEDIPIDMVYVNEYFNDYTPEADNEILKQRKKTSIGSLVNFKKKYKKNIKTKEEQTEGREVYA